jgi:hypothetical protein
MEILQHTGEFSPKQLGLQRSALLKLSITGKEAPNKRINEILENDKSVIFSVLTIIAVLSPTA